MPFWAFRRSADVTCHVCWRPLTHCACDARDVIRDPGQIAALEQLRLLASCGCWSDAEDTHNDGQQRWAFLLWRLDHGEVGPG